MKSILTEAELRMLLIDNKKHQEKAKKAEEEFFVIGKTPISLLINNGRSSLDSPSSIPLCKDFLPYLDFQQEANEVLTPQALKNNQNVNH